MDLEKIKKQWVEYNEEFDNSDFMDIDTHTSMALQVGGLINEIEQLKEDLKEIADIVETFYTESNGMRVPSNLEPIASRLSLIHRIALQKTIKR